MVRSRLLVQKQAVYLPITLSNVGVVKLCELRERYKTEDKLLTYFGNKIWG